MFGELSREVREAARLLARFALNGESDLIIDRDNINLVVRAFWLTLVEKKKSTTLSRNEAEAHSVE